MKTAIIAFIILAVFMFWHASRVDSLQVEYCWDSEGQHYLLGDERCR